MTKVNEIQDVKKVVVQFEDGKEVHLKHPNRTDYAYLMDKASEGKAFQGFDTYCKRAGVVLRDDMNIEEDFKAFNKCLEAFLRALGLNEA